MNILLVRLRLIGDVVFTTPAVRAIRQRYPAARLTYLVEEEAAAVVRGNPHLDDVIVIGRPTGVARLRGDLALGLRLRAARYDLVIDFHCGPRSSWLTWMTGAPTRIGFEVLGRSWLYTIRVARPRALRPRHSVQNQWDLLVPLGIAPPEPRTDPTEMAHDPASAAAVERRLAEAGITRGHRIIVVHVSAGNPFRRWPADAFVELICRLAAADPLRRIVVTSGPSDASAASRIVHEARDRLAPPEREALPRCGEFDLAGLRALVDRAALFIGGDSGPLHIAGTTSVPVVGLYGPTLPVRSQPWRNPAIVSEAVEIGPLPCRPCEQRRCEPGDFRCLTLIQPQAVAEAAERALARARAAAPQTAVSERSG
jgi:predicted lipopolysaccharide heptosyltransferase III